ncbi:MAG: IPTL-CTERM sorting domain-containing protein [Acidobacteriota bacterium]
MVSCDRKRLVSISALVTLLALSAVPMVWAVEVPLTLDANFNGMLHSGEGGQPDAADGFRSISDRALVVDGGAMSFGDLTSPFSGLSYVVEGAAGVLDLVHLGDRNTVDGGNWAFDPAADADNIGIQPSWLPDSDQTTAMTSVPNLPLDAMSRLGVLYQISNGGGDFDLTLVFDDATSVTVTLNGPDWFGPFAGTPDPPGPGVEQQQNLGVDYTGAEGVDAGNPGATLIVSEAVVTAGELLTDLGFDISGRSLTELRFDNGSNSSAGYAILAATVEARGPSVLEIPTVSGVGLIALVVLLALFGGWMVRRRGRAA